MTPLKILHVLRAPLGGAFRHVLDVAQGQAARGHQVGIVVASGGSANAEERLNALAGHMALGISRIPMQRQPGLSDVMAVRFVMRTVAALKPDVVHGHGAKGGAFARLAAKSPAIRVYTPHGGSLHYGRNTPAGMIYGAAERFLMRRAPNCFCSRAHSPARRSRASSARPAVWCGWLRTASAPPK